MLLHETHDEHVEKHPVGANRRAVAVAQHRGCQVVLLLLGQGIPQHLLGGFHGYGERAELKQCLARATGAVRDVVLARGVGEAHELMAVVVGHAYAVESEVGVLLEQRSGHKECSRQSFKLGCAGVVVVVGIGLLELLGEVHRVVECVDVAECSVEQIFGCFQPVRPRHSAIGAFLIVGILQYKGVFGVGSCLPGLVGCRCRNGKQ